ncbi:MAG: hypothetical protein MJZ64_01530 [Paludibacteraceae bacterium]|nr:hypothetical protein [Paludibacteraceae bacterium]
MKKIKLFALAIMTMMTMSTMAAVNEFFSFTVTSATTGADTYEAVGGSAECKKGMAAGGSNEVTIGDQTFYKFNSSSEWIMTLSGGTFQEGDILSFVGACHASSTKTSRGFLLNGTIAITGDFPGGGSNTLTYTVVADDGIAGTSSLSIKRNDSDIKFGTFVASRNEAIAYPFVKSFTAAGVEAVVDTAAKTIVAELPYGTDRAAAIADAEVVMGGTAKTFSIAGEILTAIDSVDTGKNINYDLTGIVVSENPSTDATLSMITINGVDMAGFDPAVLNYSMVTTSIPTVDAVLNDPTAKYQVNPALDFPGMTEIFVTAQDGVTKLTYSINFTSADKVCGQLVKVTVASGKAGIITGALSATADVSLSSSGKMDKGKYFGITLTEGSFKTGDVFNVNTSTAAGQGILALYADKAMTTPVYEGEDYGVAGDNLMVLPADADGLTTLYMARDANDAINNWNGVISYIEVVRDCEPKLVAFSMAGVDAVIDQEQKTVTAVLPYGTVLEDSDWDNAYTLNGAATGAEYGAEHATLTVKGGEEDVVYTLAITISQTPSSNFNLTEITVNSKAIADFRADSLAYTFELPNGTVDMPVIAAVAEDITAQVAIDEITALDQLVKIVVTAQDASKQTYTVQLSVANAPKFLYEAVFSNGVKGAIDNDAAAIVVPYLDGEAYPTLVSDSVSAGATAAMEGEDKLIVTGSDMSTKEFSITFQALSAPSFTADTITFEGSESYIYAAYGWDAEKGVKFSKAVNEESNMRITTGKTRVYMALPACYKVNLISGTGGARDIKVSVNGADPVAMKTAAKNAGMDILLSTTEVNFVAIESAQTGGDGGFVKMVMTLDVPSGDEQIPENVQENKFIYKGQFLMLNNGVLLNALGQELAK